MIPFKYSGFICYESNYDDSLVMINKNIEIMTTLLMSLFLIAFVSLYSISTFAHDIVGAPWADSPCYDLEHTSNLYNDSWSGTCYEVSGGSGWLYQAGQLLTGPNTLAMDGGFNTSYVPFAGIWTMKTHYCPRTTRGFCTLKASQLVENSVNSVYLNSSQKIVDQDPDFGGAVGPATLPWAGAACLTFVDSAGNEWSTPADRTCQDAHKLPDYPATCYINYGEDLNVDLGLLERAKIAKASLTTETVKKTIPVMCSGDAAITVSMAFQYTGININGEQLVSSSTPHLGIAVIHNGRVVDPSETYQATYQPGISYMDLEFEAVRDPNVDNSEIKAGAFTASATLVMTQQ